LLRRQRDSFIYDKIIRIWRRRRADFNVQVPAIIVNNKSPGLTTVDDEAVPEKVWWKSFLTIVITPLTVIHRKRIGCNAPETSVISIVCSKKIISDVLQATMNLNSRIEEMIIGNVSLKYP